MHGVNRFVTLFLIFLAIVLPTILWMYFPHEVRYHNLAMLYLKYFLLLPVGVQSLLIALASTISGRETASHDGQLSNAYQQQFGFACLGMGLVSIIAYWMSMPFVLASVLLACTVFLGIAASYYMYRQSGDHHGSLVFVSYILTPILLIVLTIAHYVAKAHGV